MARYSIRGQCSASAYVTVYEEDDSTLATIYASSTSVDPVSGSKVQADSQGLVAFYVESSTYPFMYLFNLLVEKTGYLDIELKDVWSSFYAFSTAPSLYVCSAYGPLREQIQRNWGRDDASSQATIMFYFNSAQQTLARIIDAPELEYVQNITLVADEDEYDPIADWLIPDLRKVKSMYVTANSTAYPLTHCSPKEWDTTIAPKLATASSDVPRRYLEWAGKFFLYPSPASAYALTLRYWREPTPITGDSSIVAFKEMDPVLVEMTTGFCFLSTEDIQAGEKHIKQAAELLKIFRSDAMISKDLHLKMGGGEALSTSQYLYSPFVSKAP